MVISQKILWNSYISSQLLWLIERLVSTKPLAERLQEVVAILNVRDKFSANEENSNSEIEEDDGDDVEL